jgi:hypothetical protein
MIVVADSEGDGAGHGVPRTVGLPLRLLSWHLIDSVLEFCSGCGGPGVQVEPRPGSRRPEAAHVLLALLFIIARFPSLARGVFTNIA